MASGSISLPKAEGRDFQVWKVPIRGGRAVQMTKKGGFAPLEADDGFLYFTKSFDIPGIWKVPSPGGTETAVLNTSDAPHWPDWAVVPGGMYFINSRSSPKPILEFCDREKNFDLCPRWRAPGLGGISRPKIHSVFAIEPGQPSDRGREEFPLKGLLSLSRVSGLQILRRACHVSNNACNRFMPYR